MDDIERCLLVKSEVFVFKIPPRQSARGYRAADWSLAAPDWTGRMRLMEKSNKVILKLEDRGSGDLFAACPIEVYPGPTLEAVTDSSRYFVIRIVNEVTKQNAFIGMGFSDRSDSFDLNVALQDHFKLVKKEDEILKEDSSSKPQLDLAFKEGQTIKVSLRDINKDEKKSRPKPRGGLSGSLLPPPPSSTGGVLLPPPSATGTLISTPVSKVLTAPPSNPTTPSPAGNIDLLADFCDLNVGGKPSEPLVPTADDPWGDFTSAESTTKQSGNWVQF